MDQPNFPDGRYTTMSALKDTLNDRDVQRKIGRIMVGTGVLMVTSAVYLKHRDVVNKAITAQQELAFDSMWASFDEGVKYGLQLAKEASEFAKNVATDGPKPNPEYMFGAFDKFA